MKTEIFLENSRLDITADLPSLLTLAIDDVKDFSGRQTSFSKTILLPGTANNNRLLGHIFEAGQSNAYNDALPNIGYNFNASKSAGCIIFQDNLQTFKGVMRLLTITNDKGRIEYEVAVFGDLFSLKVSLTGALLEDLDFSAYDHIYNADAIKGSWDANDAAPGTGVYYPLIDHGGYSVNKKDWDIRTFRPALYVKEYIDKMFASAKFRYVSPLFETERFKRLIIPHNQKNITKIGTGLATARISVDTRVLDGASPTVTTSAVVDYDTFTSIDFINDDHGHIKYNGTTAIYTDIAVHLSGGVGYVGGFARLFKDPGDGVPFAEYEFPYDQFNPLPYEINWKVSGELINPGEKVYIVFDAPELANQPGGFIDVYEGLVTISTQSGTGVELVGPGDPIEMNYLIPKNIRQVDFLVSIVKLFNLYVYEDRFDSRLIYITPYVDFYSVNNRNSVDWSYKLDRNKPIQLKPMSELNAKIYQFNYKSDNDYYNDLYNKRYGQTYGSLIYDSQYEFESGKASFELIFSPTPLVGYDNEDKVYSTIFKRSGTDAAPVEETIDSNIRILQTKKVTGVVTWFLKNGAMSIIGYDVYGYAGHLDDPDAPTNDLNFGALNEVFFILTAGTLNRTQFNVYWSSYMAEITDKDSKLLTANFYLKPSDIARLDFSKYVVVDGVLFRINKIIDFNMSQPGTSKVELLKVNYTQY